MSLIPIVFSTDHRYVMPAGVAIYSLLASSRGERYDIFILAGGDVDDRDRELLRRQVEVADAESRISFVELGESFSGAYEIRDITKAAYYRLLIPWMIPQYDKIFYSDVDVVFRQGLGVLYAADMNDSYIVGANYEEYSNGALTSHIKRMGLDAREYVNSGFMLINSKAFRDDDLQNVLLQEAKRRYEYQDQDILNKVCKGRISHFEYNVNAKVAEIERFGIENMTLIHYTGIKPWAGFTFCWDEWWRIYRKSIFYDKTLQYRVSLDIMNLQGWSNDELKANWGPMARIGRRLSILFPMFDRILLKLFPKK